MRRCAGRLCDRAPICKAVRRPGGAIHRAQPRWALQLLYSFRDLICVGNINTDLLKNFPGITQLLMVSATPF